MASLLESLTSLATPAIGQVAKRFGEADAAVSRGMEASFASVLGGLTTRSKDPGAIRQVFDLLSDRSMTAALPDLDTMVSGLASGAPSSGPGASLLTTLFGNRVGAVSELIARKAGLKNPSSGSSLLGMAAPLVLRALGEKVRDTGANVATLTNLLAAERDTFLAAAPSGVMNFVETGTPLPRVDAGEAWRSGTMAGKEYAAPATRTGSKAWLWAVVGLAALALIWFVASRNPAPAISSGAATLDSAAARTGGAVKAAAGEVAEAAGRLGAFGKRVLPGGVELNIPERGIESKLVAFIEDRSRAVNDTTWFDFDRLTFATGSATILPESEEQLDNIAAVLKAYPDVNVKVGGYTDNVGDDAANMQLSQQRADAVMQALVGKGIAARRMRAEGYGEQHPVADNATEEGRAQNRRIALRVTRK